jgi:hypothetical protein
MFTSARKLENKYDNFIYMFNYYDYVTDFCGHVLLLCESYWSAYEARDIVRAILFSVSCSVAVPKI